MALAKADRFAQYKHLVLQKHHRILHHPYHIHSLISSHNDYPNLVTLLRLLPLF